MRARMNQFVAGAHLEHGDDALCVRATYLELGHKHSSTVEHRECMIILFAPCARAGIARANLHEFSQPYGVRTVHI